MRLLILSYNLAGRDMHDRKVMEAKLARDGRERDDVFLIVCGRRYGRFALSPRIRGEAFRAWMPSLRPLCDLQFALDAPAVLRRSAFAPETIVVAEFPLVWAALRCKRAVGGTLTLQLNALPSELAATKGPFHRWYYRLHEALGARYVDRFVVINDATRAYLLRLGVPPERIELRVPDTISADLPLIARAQRGAARARLGMGAHEPLALSVGRLEPEKGFDTLIGLFASVPPPARLVIVGEGKLRGALEELIRRKCLVGRVVLAGAQRREPLWEYYRDADAFVLLSKSEALGLAVWEAMYAGVPVIGRPVGGIKESIGEDRLRGFLWDVSDGAGAFGEKLKRCFKREAEIEAMIARARAYVEEKLSL